MTFSVMLLILLALGVGVGAAGSLIRGGLAGCTFLSSRVVGRPSWKAALTPCAGCDGLR